jgi:hypothetical protein
MGFSQIFALVASYEYAYFAAPVSAQSLFMSLNFCSAGISSFISTAYINVFPKPTVDLNFKVSIKTNDFLLILRSIDFSVCKGQTMVLELLYLFLHSCRSSVNVHCYFYPMSEKVSNRQIKSCTHENSTSTINDLID